MVDTSKWNARMVAEYADSCTYDLSEEQKLQMATHILNGYEDKKRSMDKVEKETDTL
jgi:surfactin synthase thioesterase subunit